MSPHQNKRVLVRNPAAPEYTIIAFLRASDKKVFREVVREFPSSFVEQLPPHLTVLNMIFSNEPAKTVVERVEDALRIADARPFTIYTGGLLTWHNLRYQGYSIAVTVEPSEELISLRMQLERFLMPIAIPEEESLWSEYIPHVTIGLSVSLEAAQQAKSLGDPPAMEFPLDSLYLLRHGGDYFGYSRVKQFKLE